MNYQFLLSHTPYILMTFALEWHKSLCSQTDYVSNHACFSVQLFCPTSPRNRFEYERTTKKRIMFYSHYVVAFGVWLQSPCTFTRRYPHETHPSIRSTIHNFISHLQATLASFLLSLRHRLCSFFSFGWVGGSRRQPLNFADLIIICVLHGIVLYCIVS